MLPIKEEHLVSSGAAAPTLTAEQDTFLHDEVVLLQVLPFPLQVGQLQKTELEKAVEAEPGPEQERTCA